MSQWKAVHNAIKTIQSHARDEFGVDIGEEVLRDAIDGLLELRLADVVTDQFDQMTTNDLLIAQQILQTDKNVLDKAASEKGGKKKGDLN